MITQYIVRVALYSVEVEDDGSVDDETLVTEAWTALHDEETAKTLYTRGKEAAETKGEADVC